MINIYQNKYLQVSGGVVVTNILNLDSSELLFEVFILYNIYTIIYMLIIYMYLIILLQDFRYSLRMMCVVVVGILLIYMVRSPTSLSIDIYIK